MRSTGEKATEPETRPPSLEETPEWFQEHFHAVQERRATFAREATARWNRRLRHSTLLGAAAAPVLGTWGVDHTWVFPVMMFCAGSLAGYGIARREASPPTAAIVYGLATACVFMYGLTTGHVMDMELIHMFDFVLLVCTGGLIGYLCEEDRLQALPF